CIESEAATLLMMRLARAYDRAAAGDAGERHFARLAPAVGKYWGCKRGPMFLPEALECLGGNGYVEESILPRLYRRVPVHSIWEGAGIVMCLEVLRVRGHGREPLDALFSELRLARGADRRLDARIGELEQEVADPTAVEHRARRVVERLATALQAS